MQIIDAHLHFSAVASLHDAATDISLVNYSAEGCRQEQLANGVIAGIAMGMSETAPGRFPDDKAHTPMGLDLETALPNNIYHCPGINPIDLRNRGNLAAAELAAVLDDPLTVGVKLYAGYYHFYISDGIYDPVYRLAAERGLPIIIHGGVTYSNKGLLRYSHPLSFEDAISRHPELNFVISHMGEPWGMDTAALMSKSPNVMADLSGLFVTDAETIRRKSTQPEERIRFRQPLMFEERQDRWLFGSDWPLAPLGPYIGFIKDLVPLDWHDDVFYHNALRVFPRLRNDLIQYHPENIQEPV